MPRLLSDAAIDQYRNAGYFFPVRVLSDEQVLACRSRMEEFERNQGKPIHGAQRSKSHLLFTWIDEIMRSDRILDAMEGKCSGSVDIFLLFAGYEET